MSSKPRAKDVENVFAMLLLGLPLSVEGSAKQPNGLFSKVRYPYSFTLEEAVMKMRAMEVTLVNGETTTTISCGVRAKSAYSFLQKFMDARLVHYPGDRTRHKLGNSLGVVLQPTAKGVHFLQRYCQRNGVRAHESLLLSDYNSMKCIALERHVVSDKITQSKRFVYLLFQRFMGPRPNVYDPFGPPENLPTNRLNNLFVEESLSLSSSSNWLLDSKNRERVSPYSHRYFTHPDSDSLSQYYVAHSGVRVFPSRNIHGKQFEHCMTGKSVVQWLLECTDMIYPQEAVDVGNLFVRYGLLAPISEVSLRDHQFLVPDKDALYIVSAHNGRSVCQWSQAVTAAQHNSTCIINHGIKMKDILEDAGLCLLFREHLSRELCEENLSFYTELQKFTIKYNTTVSPANRSNLIALLYTIYNQFLAPGSPAELNLEHKLKAQLVCLLTQEPSKIDLPKIHCAFEKAKYSVFKMMEADSLPKFISSAEFLSGWSSLDI